ncbi:hypothetical protein ACFL3F_03050 [Planctomycetota bacterium]
MTPRQRNIVILSFSMLVLAANAAETSTQVAKVEFSQARGFYENGQQIDYGMDPEIVNHPEYGPLLKNALLAVPSLSLVTDLEHIFDSETGIYVNAMEYGRDWERPTSLEQSD